jgi:NADH:ubiquinone oxidoreductase subunit 2 (subunit N)
MYMHEPGDSTQDLPPQGAGLKAVLWASAAATLLLGIFPSLILNFINQAAGLGK